MGAGEGCGGPAATHVGVLMMSARSSALLNQQVPEDLAKLLRQEGIDADAALLCTETDLNLSGRYEQVFLLVEPDRLLTVAHPNGGWPKPVRLDLPREAIKQVRTRQGIGGGFLEVLVEGVYVEVLAYSNARSDTYHKVAKKLDDWIAGKALTTGPEDDYNPRKCPKCGMTLRFKGDICRRCVDRGAVLTRVLGLMKPYAGWAILMFVLLMVIIGLRMVPPQLLRLLVNKVLAPEESAGVATRELWLLYLVLGWLGSLVLIALGNIANGRVGAYVGTQITYDMRKGVFGRLTELSVDYYDRNSVGRLISRVVYDTEVLREFIRQATQGFLAQIVLLVVTGVMLFSISWKLALWTLLPAPLVVLASMFYWRRLYPRYHRIWDSRSRLTGTLSSILSGVRVVKAFGQERREQRRFDRSSSYFRNSRRSVAYATSIFNPSMAMLFQVGGLIAWYVGGLDVILQRDLDLGGLLAFAAYLQLFYGPLTHLTQLTDWLTRFFTATQRTFEILDTTPQIVESESPTALPRPDGGIVFENVTFGYSRHEPIIKNVSLQIRPGEHIGVVGKSGSGKTTLVNLIARFYDVDEGRVLIDGVDVRELAMDDLRRSVGVVLQDPFLFRGTIYANVTYGRREAAPEQVLAAAKAANAHDFIMRHPLGYDTFIGERGAGLSGGEKQRVSIARALLHDPKILILDEATSSVDTESEQLIRAALVRITASRTTIAVAHRLSTLKNSDRIFVVDGGQIIERGTHEELMELGGLYYRLVKIQTELSREPNVDRLAEEDK